MKSILITGASSDVGTALLSQIGKEYDLIYAHCAKNISFMDVMDDETKSKIVLISEDFNTESAGTKVVETINHKGIFPNDIVHFPAPKYTISKFNKSSYEQLDANIRISLSSIYRILQGILPYQAQNKVETRVVMMLSSCTEGVPPKYTSEYTTVKYSLLGLLKSLASEYEGRGIAINGVSPDMMETKFLSEIQPLIIEQNAYTRPNGKNLSIDDTVSAIIDLLTKKDISFSGNNIVVK